MWITLTRAGLEQLKTEGFDFHSRAAGALLARAVIGARDEAVLLDLVSLGAPLGTELDPDERLPDEESLTLLDQALLNGQDALAGALLSRGALQKGGRLDPHRLDVAFRAAIIGGKLALVQKIWDAGQGRRPSLTYVELPGPGRNPGKPLPVSLLLSPERGTGKPWDGLAIVKWLEAQGCDVKAATSEGVTLLHVAVTASDLDMVRYLLSHGLKDTTAANGAPLLLSAHDEQTALLLLTSGTSHPLPGEGGRQYRRYVESQHWTRVAAWLKAHNE
jgi:ankyrin repeat protein